MKKFLVLVLSLGVLSSMAFSWGSATHVYIYEQLKKLGAIPNTNAIFGVIAPDVFNYMFTSRNWRPISMTRRTTISWRSGPNKRMKKTGP